ILQPKALLRKKRAPLLHAHRILPRGLRVHCHHEIDLRLARDVSVLAGSDGEPGGETSDVRWEEVLAANRHAHLKNGAHQHHVCRLAAGSVDGRDLYAEVVDNALNRARTFGFVCYSRLRISQVQYLQSWSIAPVAATPAMTGEKRISITYS